MKWVRELEENPSPTPPLAVKAKREDDAKQTSQTMQVRDVVLEQPAEITTPFVEHHNDTVTFALASSLLERIPGQK